MRLADTLFRGGHLSEKALVDLCMTGERPVHIERCDICADRAVELGRWLDDVRSTGLSVADVAFPPERLAAQQTQIFRKLEQLDQPSRVIAFPKFTKADERQTGGRRIAPAWLGVAAAAGLAIGVVGGQWTARHGQTGQPADASATTPIATAPTVQTASMDLSGITRHDSEEQDRPHVEVLDAIDQLNPHLLEADSPVTLASYRGPRSGGR